MPRSKVSKTDEVNAIAAQVLGDGEQGVIFPELDDSPEHKTLLRAARKYARDKAERDAVLTTMKEKVDGSMGRVVALMHECGVKKFKHKGVIAELIDTKEKAVVKIEGEDDGAGEESE